jgi:hypothetical protein
MLSSSVCILHYPSIRLTKENHGNTSTSIADVEVEIPTRHLGMQDVGALAKFLGIDLQVKDNDKLFLSETMHINSIICKKKKTR